LLLKDAKTEIKDNANQAEKDKRQQGHPAYDLAAKFADEWDQKAFDPNYDTLPLEHFEDRVRAVFAKAKFVAGD
jgi:hypothetical protein